MKYILFLSCMIFLLGCSRADKNSKDESNAIAENKNIVTDTEKKEQTTPTQVIPTTSISTDTTKKPSVLDKMLNQTVTITGIVEVMGNDRVDIITNWKSRSRSSHVVTGDKIEEIKALKGKIITAEVTIIKVNSMWNKHVIVNSYKVQDEKK